MNNNMNNQIPEFLQTSFVSTRANSINQNLEAEASFLSQSDQETRAPHRDTSENLLDMMSQSSRNIDESDISMAAFDRLAELSSQSSTNGDQLSSLSRSTASTLSLNSHQ